MGGLAVGALDLSGAGVLELRHCMCLSELRRPSLPPTLLFSPAQRKQLASPLLLDPPQCEEDDADTDPDAESLTAARMPGRAPPIVVCESGAGEARSGCAAAVHGVGGAGSVEWAQRRGLRGRPPLPSS